MICPAEVSGWKPWSTRGSYKHLLFFFFSLLKKGKIKKRGIIQAGSMNHRVQQEDAFLQAKALSLNADCGARLKDEVT